jgi:hypothetical protein
MSGVDLDSLAGVNWLHEKLAPYGISKVPDEVLRENTVEVLCELYEQGILTRGYDLCYGCDRFHDEVDLQHVEGTVEHFLELARENGAVITDEAENKINKEIPQKFYCDSCIGGVVQSVSAVVKQETGVELLY